MENEDLLKVLIETNNGSSNPVDNEILQQVLAFVIMSPLEEDRGTCQERISYIIRKKCEENML